MSQVIGVTPQSVGSSSELVATIIGFLAQQIVLRVNLRFYVRLRKINRIWAREASRILKKRLQETQVASALLNPEYILDNTCCIRNPLFMDEIKLHDICGRAMFLGCRIWKRKVFADLLWAYASNTKKLPAHRETNVDHPLVFVGGGMAVRAKKVIDNCEIEFPRLSDTYQFFCVSQDDERYASWVDQEFDLLEEVEVSMIGTTRKYSYALHLKSSSSGLPETGDDQRCKTFIFAVNSPTECVDGGNYEFIYKTQGVEDRTVRHHWEEHLMDEEDHF
ncbi:hypothetical protein DFS34DRAFT_591877 [Phlyctochytrium arcticum]|nr:hypothetical protein DFS34DRAFT_591877 [Phlyctochytrium arcticum]